MRKSETSKNYTGDGERERWKNCTRTQTHFQLCADFLTESRRVNDTEAANSGPHNSSIRQAHVHTHRHTCSHTHRHAQNSNRAPRWRESALERFAALRSGLGHVLAELHQSPRAVNQRVEGTVEVEEVAGEGKGSGKEGMRALALKGKLAEKKMGRRKGG